MIAARAKHSKIKAQALQVVQSLPAGVPRDDLIYHIYVRQNIEAGMADITEDRTRTHASIRKAFLKP